MTIEHAIEMLKNPKKYMYIHEGRIELEGWLKEALRMGICALEQMSKADCEKEISNDCVVR